ncbi:hypothetical protein MPTK1_4g04610 [Marchantia polymorpha subsp. ruderalis]|uniref:Uncharacterized protein n=2 Tax=Marchantia polymorpha TaxID=3197 RepID=A0AAF6B6D2_MARPO|nr:hypothetical protein MARPO_0044s0013 [Marchantia polymorpha]BBN07566.1 hypothetical protein Mp_4g04610 [Marchantia polymorpha subsp. ruderalis]|eukprot:PTQ39533.1 hypothetical protein MARPO_0044s0013 [Marchantia polymorpha]
MSKVRTLADEQNVTINLSTLCATMAHPTTDTRPVLSRHATLSHLKSRTFCPDFSSLRIRMRSAHPPLSRIRTEDILIPNARPAHTHLRINPSLARRHFPSAAQQFLKSRVDVTHFDTSSSLKKERLPDSTSRPPLLTVAPLPSLRFATAIKFLHLSRW